MSSSTSDLTLDQSFSSQFIRAGAGAGKTTQLIHSFFSFVEFYKNKHQSYPRIVITTFTRKATQEVKERLLVQALARQDQDLFSYINKKSSVHISTIHGLLSLLLTRHHDLIQLNAQIKVLDPMALIKVYTKKTQNLLKNNIQFLELLENYSFKNLVRLLAQYHQMSSYKKYKAIDKGLLQKLRQEKINKASQDLLKVVSAKSEISSNKGWSEYFIFIENFYKKLTHKKVNFDELFEFYEQRPTKPRFSQSKPVFDPLLNEIISDYFSSSADFIEESDSDSFIDLTHYMNDLFFQLANEFDQEVTKYKKVTGQISINDLESYSLELIQKFPVEVEKFSKSFQYYMVDEYQDTSPLQVTILNALMAGQPQFIVGDPQQSIYLFRGARAEVFQNKEIEAIQNKFSLINLNINYRSDPQLMNCLNDIMTQMSNQFKPMIPRSNKPEDVQNKTQAYYIKTDHEFKGLINQIQRLKFSGAHYNQICILFTKNNDILEFAKFAAGFNIPVQPQVSAGFDRKREIIDLTCYLKFLVNPYDQLNLMTLLRSPWLKSTDQDVVTLRHQTLENTKNIWTQLQEAQHPDALFLKNGLQLYYTEGVLSSLDYFLKQSHFLIFNYFLDSTGLREANVYKLISDLKLKSRQDSFSLSEYISSQFKTFHDDLGSQQNESVALFSEDRVSAMTIHASKGLQFPHVIVVGLGDRPKLTQHRQVYFDEKTQLFGVSVIDNQGVLKWSQWGRDQKKELNEAEELEYQRLFYVAITRAEKSISFILDQSKSISKQSWYSKMNWPLSSQLSTDQYTVESIQENGEEPSIIIAQNDSEDSVINPENLNKKITELHQSFQEKTESVQNISVTEFLKSNSPGKNKIEKNEIKEVDKSIIDSLAKAQRGTDFHRYFESLKYLKLEVYQTRLSIEDQKIINWFFNLKELPFKRILEAGHTEWGFGINTKKGLLKGQIDLWAELDNCIYIIDYKTGSSIYNQKAFDQLKAYAQCLKIMGFIKSHHEIQIVVLYPFEEKVMVSRLKFGEI